MGEVTGLFFGSFNPIHKGHLGLARFLLEGGYCRELWFVVSPCNPFKRDQALLPEQQRFELVQRVVERESRMRVCDVEFTMPRPSYTADTLRVLQARSPERFFALIIGEDNLRVFHRWRESEWIRAHFPLLVYPRSGETFHATVRPGVTFVEAPLFPYSSTEIRRKIGQGEDVSDAVPSEILSSVLQLYGTSFV